METTCGDELNGDELNKILMKCIKNSSYVQQCTSNKENDENSLCYLIDRDMSQSDKIKLGNGCEKVLCDYILKVTVLKNIKKKNKKGEKERDHLFMDEKNKIIYYAELKANLNLDTEKSKATYNKCLNIVQELKKEYNKYEIKWCLVGLRYLHYGDIPETINKKYNIIKDNLFGINQYLEFLNTKIIFNENNYKEFLNSLANEMFSD